MTKPYWNSENELYEALRDIVKELNLDLETFDSLWNEAVNKSIHCSPYNGKSFHEYYTKTS